MITTRFGADHEDLIQRLGGALLDLVPEDGWRRIDLAGTANGTELEFALTVIMADGSRPEVQPPPELGDVLVGLRSVLDDPEHGPWRAARYSIDPPGAIYYNYDFGQKVVPGTDEPLTAEQAHERLKVLTTRLIHAMPPEWDQLFVDVRSVGGFVELPARLITVLGGAVDWTLPDGVAEFFVNLKADMARPGSGAWTSVRYRLTHPSRYSAEYDWDGEPDWDHVPAREFFVAEAEQFPREPVPDWLDRRVVGA